MHHQKSPNGYFETLSFEWLYAIEVEAGRLWFQPQLALNKWLCNLEGKPEFKIASSAVVISLLNEALNRNLPVVAIHPPSNKIVVWQNGHSMTGSAKLPRQ